MKKHQKDIVVSGLQVICGFGALWVSMAFMLLTKKTGDPIPSYFRYLAFVSVVAGFFLPRFVTWLFSKDRTLPRFSIGTLLMVTTMAAVALWLLGSIFR